MDEKDSKKVSEPSGGEYALQDYCITDVESEMNYDFECKDFGYAKTLEELDHALDEADAERNDPSKWVTPVEFHSRIENKYPWLR